MSPRDPDRRRRRIERKDKLIQARVAGDLEQTLKREAARRRLSVSHLVRNTLEDAFTLVEDVTADVGQLVTGSVELASAVSRDARRLASRVRGEPEPEPADDDPADEVAVPTSGEAASRQEGGDAPFVHVYGWNRVIANRAVQCARCRASIERGDEGLVGLSDEPGPRVWLCEACADAM